MYIHHRRTIADTVTGVKTPSARSRKGRRVWITKEHVGNRRIECSLKVDKDRDSDIGTIIIIELHLTLSTRSSPAVNMEGTTTRNEEHGIKNESQAERPLTTPCNILLLG